MKELYNRLTIKNDNDTNSTQMFYSIGSVLGAFLGDALGAYYEFKAGKNDLYNEKVVFLQKNPVWGTKPGQITDDSEMALSLAYGLMESIDSSPNFNKVAYYYGNWYLGGPYDIGNTTRNAMKTVTETKTYKDIKDYYSKNLIVTERNYNYFEDIYKKGFEYNSNKLNSPSLSNGFLMRKTPLAIFCMLYIKNSKIVDLSDEHIENLSEFKNACKNDTALTHSHLNCPTAAIIYSMIITRIIYLKSFFPEYKEVGINTLMYIKSFIVKELKSNFSGDLKEMLELIDSTNNFHKKRFSPEVFYDQMCWYMHGLLYVIKALKVIDNDDNNYYDTVKDVINLGGDTDTNAAIVGGVLGAFYGPDKLNNKLETLLYFNPYKSGSKYERSSMYSPGFVLFAVERFFEIKDDMLNKREGRYTHHKSINNLPIAISTLLKYFTN